MSVLGELREFVKSVVEVMKTVPPDHLAVFILGLLSIGAALGFGGAWAWRKIKKGPSTEIEDTTPPAVDCTACPDHQRLKAQLSNVTRLIDTLENDDSELWQFHKSQIPHALLDTIYKQKLRVLTLANLKGGVGKTTISANLAAYFAGQGMRVLLIDFDYQGSLSATVLRAVGKPHIYSEADKLLNGKLGGPELLSPTRRMGPALANVTLVPAEADLNRQENRLLMRWLLQIDSDDPRYALAKVLADPQVLNEFQLVIIDTPPRLGLATLNAMCASTHFLVPTILDQASIINVGSLLSQVDDLFRQDLNPRLEFAGIIGTMTPNRKLGEVEEKARSSAEGEAQRLWGARAGGLEAVQALDEWPDNAYVLASSVPDTVRFREDAGHKIAYLDNRQTNDGTRKTIDELGKAVAARIGL